MKRMLGTMILLISVFLLILSGCKTTEPEERIPVHMPDSAASVEQPEAETEPAEKIDEPAAVIETVAEPVVVAVEQKDNLVIHIAATGNIQGELFGVDMITGEHRNASLSQFYSYLEQVSTEYGDNLLLLDHGNALTGSFVTSYWNAVKAPEEDHIIASVMNAMGYKAAVAGARDIGMDAQILSAAVADFDFPVLSANLIYSDSRESVLPSHAIVSMGEVSIAVVGVTGETEGLPEEFELIDALQAVNSTVGSLNADAVVVLVSGSMQLSEKIASESRGVDVIIGGDRLASRLNRVNHPVYIIGTQPKAQKAAAAGLLFSWNGDRYELAGVETTMIDISSYQASPAAIEAFAPILDELEQALMTRVGYLSDTIDTRKAQIADSSVVDLIHDMQMKISGADISFASAPVARAPLLEGPVYVRDVLHALRMLGLGERLPSLYVVEMTGQEIDAYLEHSYGMWFRTMSSIDDRLIKGTDFELYDTAAGIKYIVDVRGSAGNRVKITTTASGEKFMREDSYSVVLNEFRAHDIGAYLSQGLGLSVQQVQQRIQRVIHLDLVRSLQLQESMLGTLEPSTDGNWFASPRIWAQRAAQKEGLVL